MTLRLELDRILYDPQEGLLHLFATDGEMLVRCAVSKAALPGVLATAFRTESRHESISSNAQ